MTAADHPALLTYIVFRSEESVPKFSKECKMLRKQKKVFKKCAIRKKNAKTWASVPKFDKEQERVQKEKEVR